MVARELTKWNGGVRPAHIYAILTVDADVVEMHSNHGLSSSS